jgi:hypothetical protein
MPTGRIRKKDAVHITLTYLPQMSAESTTTIPPSLHTDICPNCSYSLAGLPACPELARPERGRRVEGSPQLRCPECGRAYDQSEIIIYG